MKYHTRIAIGSVMAALSLLWYGAGPVGAVPSDTCRDLATRYANTPAQLDSRYLAALMICVSTEVGERMGVAEIVPVASSTSTSPQAEESPAPVAEPEASPPPRRDYGTWPAPPAWGREWPAASWYQP